MSGHDGDRHDGDHTTEDESSDQRETLSGDSTGDRYDGDHTTDDESSDQRGTTTREYIGTVRGFGHGGSGLDIYVHYHSTSRDLELERLRAEIEVERNRRELENAKMKRQLQSLFEIFHQFIGSSSVSGSSLVPGSSSQPRLSSQRPPNSSTIPAEAIAPGYVGIVPPSYEPALHGASCFLLDIDSSERHIVAMGKLIETDPRARDSQNQKLSLMCCLVEVMNVKVVNYELPFPYHDMIELGDTQEKIIKWYRDSVEIIRD